MCQLYSWGIITSKEAAKKLAKPLRSIIFLTDSEARILVEKSLIDYDRSFTWDDVQGHAALAAYYRLDECIDFKHCEDFDKVPRPIARAINAGQLDELWRHSDHFAEGVTPPRFTAKGQRKGIFNNSTFAKAALALIVAAMAELYPDRDNTEAIQRAKKALETKRTTVAGLFVWSGTPEGYPYWSAIDRKTEQAIGNLI
jgi:hypothetical protein